MKKIIEFGKSLTGYMQGVEMTDEEKLKMYLQEPKEKIAKMLIECSKQLNKKLETAGWCCRDCGEKYGTYREGIETYHLDKCDVCGGTKEICHVRRYNYLRKKENKK